MYMMNKEGDQLMTIEELKAAKAELGYTNEQLSEDQRSQKKHNCMVYLGI